MFFLSFFENVHHFLFGMSAICFLGFTTWVASPVRYAKGLNELFGAFIIFFLTALFYNQYMFFTANGVSYSVQVFIRLFLTVVATVLLAMAASEILFSKELPVPVLFLALSFGLLISLYAVFVASSADVEENIGLIVPIIGFVYLFLSFISEMNLKRKKSAVMAAFCVLGFIEQIALNVILDIPFSFMFTLVLILILGAAFLMMTAEYESQEKDMVRDNLKKISDNMENIIKSSPFPIVISRLKNDTIVFANQNALKIFDMDASELSMYHFSDFFVDAKNRKLLLERLEHNRQVQDFEILVKTMLSSTPFWLMASANVIEYKGELVLYMAFQDITSRKQREQRLIGQANRDPLTSIYNRRYFEETVPQKIRAAKEANQPFAILMIDADHFKNINDTYGHKTGDKVLIELAQVAERALRPDDIVARFGGEEFVVFLNNVTEDVAMMVAGRLKDAISSLVVYSDDMRPVTWTVSIGLAASVLSDHIDLLIKMADDAMYLAKTSGRNRIEKYDAAKMNAQKDNTPERGQVHPALEVSEEEEISLIDETPIGYL